MADLAKYYTDRSYPPTEVPGGVRWYTEEEVSAYRQWLTGCRLSNRQRAVVSDMLAEIDKRQDFLGKESSGPQIVGDYYAGPVYQFGAVSALVVVIIGSYLLLFGWFAWTVARGFLDWNSRNFGLGFLIVAGGVGLIYHFATWAGRIGANDEDPDWPGTL